MEWLSRGDDDLVSPLVAAKPQAVLEIAIAVPELPALILGVGSVPSIDRGEEGEPDEQPWLADEHMEPVFA